MAIYNKIQATVSQNHTVPKIAAGCQTKTTTCIQFHGNIESVRDGPFDIQGGGGWYFFSRQVIFFSLFAQQVIF